MIRSPFDTAVFNFHWSSQPPPAAGADFQINSVDNGRSELIALSFTFTADANVANRTIRIYVRHSTLPVFLGACDIPMGANDVREIIVGQHGHGSSVDGGDILMVPISSFPFMVEGDAIFSEVTNIQATDQIGTIRYGLKVWTFEQ